MKKLQTVIAALQADNPGDFVQAIDDHVAGREADLAELLQAASRKDMADLCEGLRRQVEVGASLFNAEPQAGPEEGGGEQLEEPGPEQEAGSEVLMGAAMVATMVFAETRGAPPEALLQAAVMLHDNALLAACDYPALQNEVAGLCVDWWQAELPGREQLTTQTVPYLLVEALQSGSGAAVKRCHAMRAALELFDFDDPSIADLKRLLLRAAFAPSFLRTAEGRRFLAFLFTLQPAFVRELTAIVRNQIPAGRKSVLEAYGDVVYRAWAGATGACLLEVQQTCIQGLMESAVLASSQPMASALRRVLGGLHSQKHQPGVDAMLLQLYEPILFRRLNAANADVRRNALNVLVDAFPLRDPEESNEATDRRLADQFGALSAALKDDAPAVRAAAVAGVCRVLNAYWEVIPGAVTAGYVKAMAADLALDATSPAVRAAVAEGLATLVDNALAQPLLKAVLPKLEPMLYDTSARVRTAFADLLLALRGVRALRWHDVAGVQALLEVMAADVPAVSERIQRLLLPSYFPDLATGPAMVAALLRASPAAGRSFCLYLAGVHQPAGGGVGAAAATPAGSAVSQDALVALVRDLTAHLADVPLATAADVARAAKGGKTGRAKRRKARGDDDEAPGEEEAVEVVETVESWESILGGLAAVCCGLGTLIAVGDTPASVAAKLFKANALGRLLERCPGARARCQVAAIAAALPEVQGAAAVRHACLLSLLGEGGAGPEEAAAVDCVCADPASRAALLRAIAAAFGADPAGVVPEEEEAARRGAPSKQRKQLAAAAELEAQLSQGAAFRLVGSLLALEGPRDYVMASGVLSRLLPWLGAALGVRVSALQAAVGAAAGAEECQGAAPAAAAMPTFLRACLHLFLASQAEEGDDAEASGVADREVACGQALEGVQQAIGWAAGLLRRLAEAEADDLAGALSSRPAGNQPKRSKSAAGKRAVQADTLPAPAAALREAYAAAQGAVALLAEAAALQIVGWASPTAPAAAAGRGAASMATLSVKVVRRVAEAGRAGGAEADSAAVVAALSLAARLARHLAASAKPAAAAASRDLDSELQQAAAGGEAGAAGAERSTAVASLAAELVELMCSDADGGGLAVAGIKPQLAGLVAALGEAAGWGGLWLGPLARLVGGAVDLSDVPAVQAMAEEGPQQDENSSAAANKADTGAGDGGKVAAAGAVTSFSEVLSSAADHAAVKQITAAAKAAKAEEALAGQAAEAAAAAWRRGDAQAAIGGVELAQLLGFKGVTARGRSKAGGSTHAVAVRELRAVHDSVMALPAAQLVPPAMACLHHKLHALFPPAPRVTFEGM